MDDFLAIIGLNLLFIFKAISRINKKKGQGDGWSDVKKLTLILIGHSTYLSVILISLGISWYFLDVVIERIDLNLCLYLKQYVEFISKSM